MKHFKYLGTEKDTHIVPGVGFVSKGATIDPMDKAHVERIKAATFPDGTSMFEEVDPPKAEADTDTKPAPKDAKK